MNVIADVETIELGAGSYPEEPNFKEKCYIIECDMSCKCNISVWAKTFDEAKEKALNNKYNIEEYYDNKIEDIINYRVED